VLFEQFYLGCLAHASYMIGSDGVAAVVDLQLDVQIYLDTAANLGLRIAHIIETHLHADFVSGHRERAERTGAPLAVHCKAGYRSTIACSLLESAGFTNITNLVGGLDTWIAAGLPT
jgi:rhodanese-related sulfurtransferase